MRKGFTLIELLAVIAILAVILLIAVPKIIGIIETVKINSNNNQIKNILNAAELYSSNKILNGENYEEYISIETLLEDGYLKEYPIDFITGSKLLGMVKTTNKEFVFIESSDSGEVIALDNSKEIKNIIIEGNSLQSIENKNKNLFDIKSFIDNGKKNGLTENYIKEDVYNSINVLNHKQIAYTENYWDFMKDKFKSNTSYTLSFKGIIDNENDARAGMTVSFYYNDSSSKSVEISTALNEFSLTSDSLKTIEKIKFTGWKYSGNAYLWDVQLEEGTSKTEYQEFKPGKVLPSYPIEVKSVKDSELIMKTCDLYDINTMKLSQSTNAGNIITLNDHTYDRILYGQAWIPEKNKDYTIHLEVLENTFNKNLNIGYDSRFYIESASGTVPAGQTGEFIFNIHSRNDYSSVTIGSLWFWTYNTVDGVFKMKMHIYEGNYNINNIDEASNCNDFFERKVTLPELRKVGLNSDTYNVKTGELTRNVSEILFDGSEEWIHNKNSDKIFNDVNVFHLIDSNWHNQAALSDNFTLTNSNSNDEQIRIGNNYLFVYLNKGKALNLSNYKSYLNENNIHIYYESDEPVISQMDEYIFPEDIKYMYMTGEVKGTINIEYE